AACLHGVETDGLRVDAEHLPAQVSGDSRLLERLATNLVLNASRHNIPEGAILVRTETRDGKAVLFVANTGTEVPPHAIGRMFEPFERLDGSRVADRAGLGLGLSIVAAVAEAHSAEVTATPRAGGGLEVEVV